jgi:hypothetical protein
MALDDFDVCVRKGSGCTSNEVSEYSDAGTEVGSGNDGSGLCVGV